MLYPYRPSSVKNQQRWNFGVLCPQSYSEAQNGNEAWIMQTECLVESSTLTALEVRVRFLQLSTRTISEASRPTSDLPPGDVPEFHPVESLVVDGRLYQPWQEAVEREVTLPVCTVEALSHDRLSQANTFPGEEDLEFIRNAEGLIVGAIGHRRAALSAVVEVTGEASADDVFKICVHMCNSTPFTTTNQTRREDALLSSLVSVHTVLGIQDGRFVSLLAPPEPLSELAASCKNIGTWPVLVGEEGEYDTLLSSPIILYDYPQIAPESAGDLFDGTEIDEILSLRIMTLTDDEKREMSQSDERARAMLERTETMPVEQLMKLHGVMRNLRPLKEETQ
jgi:hypothetical protein